MARIWQQQELGHFGERVAERYLRREGMRCVERNWSCRVGEIDLIMMDVDSLVFVEVKTRILSATTKNYLFASIDRRKRTKLRNLANIYMLRYQRLDPRINYRIDLLGVVLKPQDLVVSEIRHLVAAL